MTEVTTATSQPTPDKISAGEVIVPGIEVVSVSGNAAAAGLRKGDIIISVNKKRVKTIKEMRDAIKKDPKALLLNLQRETRGLFILIQ